MKETKLPIFDANTVEFVTVAAEFCGFLERTPEMQPSEFVDRVLKLLPLLYLKASLLPDCEPLDDIEPETFVTETDYEHLRNLIAVQLGPDDDYLEVFLDEMAFSDTPIKQNISESLADIYQPLKDFVCVYSIGFEPTMNDALVRCKEHFKAYWGRTLVNVMRALHNVKYNENHES
ncbi:MAG: DUF5063 domain-containing protein [Phocaeicola sp.]|nr:DUF5063 domain-containing protein [Phocaeicola sp.]